MLTWLQRANEIRGWRKRLLSLLALGLGTVGLAAGPKYFESPAQAVSAVSALLSARDWNALADCYDLSLTPEVKVEQLRSGEFFLATDRPAGNPAEVLRWKQPFAPGARFAETRPLGSPSTLPCIWTVSTLLSIDQGGGQVQKVRRDCRMLQTAGGYQLLPPAPTESPETTTRGRNDDVILRYRPALAARARQTVPEGRLSHLPQLVLAIEQLREPAAAHQGSTGPGGNYVPSDEELLLSLAGDRLWRSLQLAPPGALAHVRANNPDFTVDSVEYPHLEITEHPDAAESARWTVQRPVARRLHLREP